MSRTCFTDEGVAGFLVGFIPRASPDSQGISGEK